MITTSGPRQSLHGPALYPVLLPMLYAVLMGGFSGCASWTQPVLNRPVEEDSVKGLVSTVSLSADRRTVVVVTGGASKGQFCAEPPPDSATSLATRADLSGSAKKEGIGEVGFAGTDRTATAVTVMADRTPSLDGFRIGIYALCQYRINGMITDEAEFTKLFTLLINKFSDNIKEEAQRTPRPIYIGGPPPLDKSPIPQPQKSGASQASN